MNKEKRQRKDLLRDDIPIIKKCILVFLILVSIRASYSNATTEKDQPASFTGSTTWTLYKSIKTKLYDVYLTVNSLYTGSISNLIESGMDLLHTHNDPVGAEILCKIAVKDSPFKVDAWICLGESRINIHNAAWSKNNQGDFVFQKLSEAKMNFVSALELDHGATNARVRLNLGVTLYLTAIRDPNISTKESSQLLFDAVNHLEAAASLTSYLTKEGQISDQKLMMHIASLYNSGLAHLATGDYLSSIPFFRKVVALTYDYDGLSVPQSNLAAALGQKGSFSDGFNRLHELSLKYCNIDVTDIEDDADETFMISFSKLCSLIHKNLEMNSRGLRKFIDIASSGSGINTEPGGIIHQSRLTSDEDSVDSKESSSFLSKVKDSIPAIEMFLEQYPSDVNLLISLSHAKIKIEDYEAAIEAALLALKGASNNDERTRATIALELAYRFTNADKILSNTLITETEHFEIHTRNTTIQEEELNLEEQRPNDVLMSDGASLESFHNSDDESLDEVMNLERPSNEKYSNASKFGGDFDRFQEELSIQAKIDENDTHNSDINITYGNVEQHDNIDMNTNQNSFSHFELRTEVNNVDSYEDDNLDAKSDRNNSNEIYITEKSSVINVNPESDASKTHPSDAFFSEDKDDRNNPLMLPPLFEAEKKALEPLCQTSISYMKMADAYMQNGNFKAASKQFLKVLKKTSYTHIPALLGYASSLERLASPQTVMAYTNVTRNALSQDAHELATASFERALGSALFMKAGKLDALHHLRTICFTNKMAAEIYFEIGLEMSIHSADRQQIIDSYKLANAYSLDDTGTPHAPSLLELAKLAFLENDHEQALSSINNALTEYLDDRKVEALTYLGRISEIVSDWDGATQAYKEAVTLPLSNASADANYYFGLFLRAHGGSDEEVRLYLEKALNLGFNLTFEATDILGEHNIAVIKSAHRSEWQRYQDLTKEQQELRGGIMNHGPLSGNSIFSQPEPHGSNEDKLTILEQGAVSYDGSSVPMGETEGEISSPLMGSLSRSKMYLK